MLGNLDARREQTQQDCFISNIEIFLVLMSDFVVGQMIMMKIKLFFKEYIQIHAYS